MQASLEFPDGKKVTFKAGKEPNIVLCTLCSADGATVAETNEDARDLLHGMLLICNQAIK